ncbi:MAG: beta-N-acetylglucosaminidase domain-containing protein [Clostridia bacterium]|nr:beta-N-acetylglucosaminidase domain-containing protein [Clostridia bacterium]
MKSRVYEIIPSPHSITYEDHCYDYQKAINVVCGDGSLEAETVSYIKEIFGDENVTFATGAQKGKTNLYLTSVDQNDAISARIKATCGDAVNNATLSKKESHVIVANGNGISIIGGDAEGLFRGLTTVKFIKPQIEKDGKYRGFVINDYADMAFRGLIEGYYGLPWSWSEKAELIKFGADFKMNKLVYAPKDDPYHTTKWHELYPDASENAENNIQNVKIAAETARRYKADLVWTAHCFGYTETANAGENAIRYNAGDENVEGSHINLLKAKFQQLYDAGVRTFGLLLDDVHYGPRTLHTPWKSIYNPGEVLTEEVLAETTAIVNIIADWCREKGDCYDLIFCPASYNLSWMKKSFPRFYTQAYEYQEVSYYDLHFKDNVQIITTGAGVFADTDQSMADRFKTEGVSTETGYREGQTRRAPLQWTNYPTVDRGNVLDFGPIANFRTDLNPEDIYGLMSNPFQWAQFNKTVIPMVCQYTWNLKAYDAAAVYNDSMKYVMDTEELSDAMLIFTNHNNKRGDEGEGTPELIDAIAAFKENISAENAKTVAIEINKIIHACDVLLDQSKFQTVAMHEQIKPYAKALKDLASAIGLYVGMFESDTVIADMYLGEALYRRHTSYPLKDVTGKDQYTATGTRTLKPFALWLMENHTAIVLAANKALEGEITHRDALRCRIKEAIDRVRENGCYYGKNEKRVELLSKLEEKREAMEKLLTESAYADLPAVTELEAWIEQVVAAYRADLPIRCKDHLVSSGKVASGALLNRDNDPASINDGDLGTYAGVSIDGDKGFLQIDLGESVPLEEIYVLCYNKDDRYYHYNVYTSEDGESFKLLIEKRDDASEKAVGGNCWRFQNGERARYVRVVGVLCSISNNPNFHIKELQIYAASAN